MYIIAKKDDYVNRDFLSFLSLMTEIFSEFHKRSINVGAEMIKKKPINDNKRLIIMWPFLFATLFRFDPAYEKA